MHHPITTYHTNHTYGAFHNAVVQRRHVAKYTTRVATAYSLRDLAEQSDPRSLFFVTFFGEEKKVGNTRTTFVHQYSNR